MNWDRISSRLAGHQPHSDDLNSVAAGASFTARQAFTYWPKVTVPELVVITRFFMVRFLSLCRWLAA